MVSLVASNIFDIVNGVLGIWFLVELVLIFFSLKGNSAKESSGSPITTKPDYGYSYHSSSDKGDKDLDNFLKLSNEFLNNLKYAINYFNKKFKKDISEYCVGYLLSDDGENLVTDIGKLFMNVSDSGNNYLEKAKFYSKKLNYEKELSNLIRYGHLNKILDYVNKYGSIRSDFLRDFSGDIVLLSKDSNDFESKLDRSSKKDEIWNFIKSRGDKTELSHFIQNILNFEKFLANLLKVSSSKLESLDDKTISDEAKLALVNDKIDEVKNNLSVIERIFSNLKIESNKILRLNYKYKKGDTSVKSEINTLKINTKKLSEDLDFMIREINTTIIKLGELLDDLVKNGENIESLKDIFDNLLKDYQNKILAFEEFKKNFKHKFDAGELPDAYY